jgi:hypothetical protein
MIGIAPSNVFTLSNIALPNNALGRAKFHWQFGGGRLFSTNCILRSPATLFRIKAVIRVAPNFWPDIAASRWVAFRSGRRSAENAFDVAAGVWAHRR